MTAGKKSREKSSQLTNGVNLEPTDLAASTEIYRRLAKTSRDIIYSAGQDGTLHYVSDQVTLYGFTRQEMQGSAFLDFVHPDDRDQLIADYQRSIETGEEFPTRFRLINSRGKAFWFEDFGAVQKDEQGQPVGMVGMLRDISERQRNEQELAVYKDRLEKLVEERTREISRANKLLEREIETRRETAAELARNEELYRTVVDTMNEGLGLSDEKMDIFYANDALCRLMGYSREELYGRNFIEFISQEYRDKIKNQYSQRLDGSLEGFHRYRLELICGDGTRKPVLISPRPILDEDGRFKASIAVVTDISEQVQAENALKESSERYRLLIDNAGVSIYLLSEEGRVLLCNNLTAAYLGRAPEELVDRTLDELLTPRQAARHLRDIREAIHGGKELNVVYHARINGNNHWFKVNIQPYPYSKEIPAVQVIAHDITELKEIQRHLRRERDSLEERVNESVAALQNSEQQLQERLRELTCLYRIHQEFDREETTEETMSACSGIISQALDDPRRKGVTINLDGKQWTTAEWRGDRDNCLQKFIEVAGVNRGFLRVCSSSPEVVFQPFEQDLIDHAGSLLADFILNQELRSQLIQSEKMAAAGRLASGVAHEINNPLGAIKNSLHILRSAVPEESDDFQYVELMDREIDRVAGIVAQLYNLYRPSSSEVQDVNLGEVTDNVLKMVQSQVERRKIEVRNEITAPGPTMSLNLNQITQVLYNIILNALQAMPLGGRLTIGCTRTRSATELWISDTGPGIPDDVLPHIFEPFYSTKTKGSHVNEGMGIGLSLSRSFIEAMGGSITVDTRPGWGATFTLTFPTRKGRRTREKRES